MKICNYCGTAMDNSVMKCPFCRMEMDIRGAVKYQDNEPYDPNAPEFRARDGMTPSELRYEEMLDTAHEEHGLSYKSIFKRHSEDLTTDAKSLIDKERKKEESIRKLSKSLSKPRNPLVKARVFIVAMLTFFIFLVALGIIVQIEYGYELYEGNYETAEEFVPGVLEDGIYENRYTGITFDTEGICDYSNIYTDDENLWFSEFYAQNQTDYMYITYINRDYSGYDSIDEFIDLEKSITDGADYKFVSYDMNYLCGYEFEGITTYHEFEDEDDGKMYGYYNSYMVCQVTDEYYAVVEIVSEDYDDIAPWLDGF